MSDSSFLDAGVMFGYCFITDDHHKPCRDYLNSDERNPYIGDWRDEVFKRKKDELRDRYSGAIEDHVANLTRSDYEGRLDLLDIRNIKSSFLDSENEAYQFLWDYYDKIQTEIQLSDLQDKLRQVGWEIEANALKRKREFDKLVDEWNRKDEYPEIEAELGEIPSEDREVCIDGHDLATKMESRTELATTDPKDFEYNGRRELIIGVTNIDEIVSLSIS